MASFNPLDVLLQKVFVLATGTAASRVELNNLAGLLGPSGNDYASLIRAIDGHMASYAVQYGMITAVQDVIANGTGQRIDTSEAKKLINDFISPDGKSGWGNLFANYVLSTSDNGKALQNRAEAAQEFIELIATANKNELLNGAAIHQAVKTQIDSIDKNVSTLNQAKEALGLIATHLNSSGLYVKAIDGYLSGATTFVDFDRDKFQDNGEWFTKTDSGGNLNLSKMAMGKNMIATGGTDIMTGQAFLGTLSAPVGSTVITPLTTLVDALVDKGHSVASAKSLVQTGLAVPFVNLLTYDPLPVLADSLSTPSSKATALQVQSISQQVAGVLTNAMVMLTKEGKTKASAFDAIVSSVADELASNPAVKLDDAKMVKTIFQSAANKIGSSDLFAQAEKLAGVVADVNGKAAAATTVLDLGKLHVIAQYDLPKAINTTASFDPTGFSGTGLTTKIGAATPKDVLPGVSLGDISSPSKPDTKAPLLLNASISSKDIILLYDQNLYSGNISSKDVLKNLFSVSVDTIKSLVTGVVISGPQVKVSIADEVFGQQVVKLSYTPPEKDDSLANQAIQNNQGIDTSAISYSTLVNNLNPDSTDKTPPELFGSITTSDDLLKVILTFNEKLSSLTFFPPLFSIKDVDTNKEIAIKHAKVVDEKVEIILEEMLPTGINAEVTYQKPAVYERDNVNVIRDLVGNIAADFTSQKIQINDKQPPKFDTNDIAVSADSTNPKKIIVSFDKDVSIEDYAGFTLTQIRGTQKTPYKFAKEKFTEKGKQIEIDISDIPWSNGDKLSLSIAEKSISSSAGIKNEKLDTQEIDVLSSSTTAPSTSPTDGDDNLTDPGTGQIDGRKGNDTIDGGDGADTLTGGEGNDIFVFKDLPSSVTKEWDTITDFKVGEDKIHISKTAFDKLKSLGSLSSAEFLSLSVAGEKNATTKDNRLIYNTADGNLYYDADGSELAANPILIGTFTGTPSLSVSDFVIIA